MVRIAGVVVLLGVVNMAGWFLAPTLAGAQWDLWTRRSPSADVTHDAPAWYVNVLRGAWAVVSLLIAWAYIA